MSDNSYLDPLPNHPSVIILDITEELSELRRNTATLDELTFYEPEVLADALLIISNLNDIDNKIDERFREAYSTYHTDLREVELFLKHWKQFVHKLNSNILKNNLYKGNKLFYQYKGFRPELLFMQKTLYPELDIRSELKQRFNINRWSI